jgi:hypothetical protein
LLVVDPTLDDVQPHYAIYSREVGAPLVKTASRVVTPIESQRDRHNPIKLTGGFADREIPSGL